MSELGFDYKTDEETDDETWKAMLEDEFDDIIKHYSDD
jgi:hypothetical protein